MEVGKGNEVWIVTGISMKDIKTQPQFNHYFITQKLGLVYKDGELTYDVRAYIDFFFGVAQEGFNLLLGRWIVNVSWVNSVRAYAGSTG